MHEFSVMDSLMRLLVERAQANGITQITRVRLVVGRLRGLDIRQLRGCFDILAEDTLAAGVTLDIDSVLPEGDCRACGEHFSIPNYVLLCPVCGCGQIDIVRGRELHVESFDGHRTPHEGPSRAGTAPAGALAGV